jgi:hypothetical protein
MRWGWLENGAVRDYVDGDPAKLFTADIAALFSVELPDGTERGATLIGGVWTNPPPPAPVDPPPPEPPPVPQLIEKRKLKLEMLATPWPPTNPSTNLLAFVNATVAAGSQALQIEWADATQISRTRDVVVGMKAAAQAAADLSEDQADALMDDLFRKADLRP